MSEDNRLIEGGELPLPDGMSFRETEGLKLYFDKSIDNGLGFILRGCHHNAEDLENFLARLEEGQSDPDLDKAA